jgi:hypothetical protein
MDRAGFLYVYWPRAFLLSVLRRYKIGRARDLTDRSGKYKGAQLLFAIYVADHVRIETLWKAELRKQPACVVCHKVGEETVHASLDLVIDTLMAVIEREGVWVGKMTLGDHSLVCEWYGSARPQPADSLTEIVRDFIALCLERKNGFYVPCDVMAREMACRALIDSDRQELAQEVLLREFSRLGLVVSNGLVADVAFIPEIVLAMVETPRPSSRGRAAGA